MAGIDERIFNFIDDKMLGSLFKADECGYEKRFVIEYDIWKTTSLKHDVSSKLTSDASPSNGSGIPPKETDSRPSSPISSTKSPTDDQTSYIDNVMNVDNHAIATHTIYIRMFFYSLILCIFVFIVIRQCVCFFFVQ